MLKQCQDSYSTQFTQFPAMLAHHEESRKASLWERIEVNRLRVAALDTKSPLYEDKSGFDPSVSQEAIVDTAENLGLAIRVGGRYFPLRDTAYKSLLDRAKINGTALPKLARAKLAEVLNSCLELHKDSALLLIRDEKVSAAHSGDSRDYSILEIDQLLDGLQKKMDERFPGNEFESGYSDHVETSRLIQKYRNAACRKPLAIGVFCYSKANYIDYAYRIIKRHGGFSLVPFLLPLHETPVLHQLAPTYTSPHQKPAYPLYIFSQTLFARP